MLVAFSVNHFMSIGSKQTLSMIPSMQKSLDSHLLDVEELHLLKHAVIFGANSSGKSNFIKAIAFGKQLLLEGMTDKFKNAYSKLVSEAISKITTWEYSFYSNHRFFTYGFSADLSVNKICEEWLMEINPKNDRSKMIFERQIEPDTFTCYLKLSLSEQKRLNTYIQDMNRNDQILFVNEMNRNKQLEGELSVFSLIYSWFEEHLIINLEDSSHVYGFFHKEYQEHFMRFISEFDTGIENVVLKSISWEDFSHQVSLNSLDFIKNFCKKNPKSFSMQVNQNLYGFQVENCKIVEVYHILFQHQNIPFMFGFSEESEGTKRVITLIDLLIEPKNNTIYVWDEIDRSVHPLLIVKYLEKYLETTKNAYVQLLFSTHETNILSQNRLRRDEIWFMEKGIDQSSKLYSLDIFKERLDKKISNSYLEGSYGGIPNIDIKDE